MDATDHVANKQKQAERRKQKFVDASTKAR